MFAVEFLAAKRMLHSNQHTWLKDKNKRKELRLQNSYRHASIRLLDLYLLPHGRNEKKKKTVVN